MKKFLSGPRIFQPLLKLSAAGLLLASQAAVADSTGNATQGQNANQDQNNQVRQLEFTEVDFNNDNRVDWDELNQAYGDQLPEVDLNEEKLFGTFDLDQDNGLSQIEYHAFTMGFMERRKYPATEINRQDQEITGGQESDDSVEAVVGVTEIRQIPFEEIEDRVLVNLDNEKIGKVEDVVMTHDGSETGLVVSTGGFLGLGARNVVIDVNEVHLTEEQVVWEKTSGDDAVDELPEYDEKDYVSVR